MQKTYLKRISVGFFVAVLQFNFTCLSESAAQEPFPTRPITILRPSTPGGQADVMLRIISKAAEKELGQPILVENKPGGGGIVAMTSVTRAKPDGYTLMDGSTSLFINVPHMQTVSFDVVTDFTQIIVDYKYTHGLAVRADSPFKTFEDITAFARKNPGKFSYGSSPGIGTTQHIVMERIAIKEGIRWTMVPFKSGAESTIACLGGHLDSVAQGPGDLVQYIKAGKLRLILQLNDQRWDVAPDVPTVFEKYGFYGLAFHSIFGPKGLPDRIVNILHDAFKKAATDKSFIDACNTSAIDIKYMNGKDYDKAWKPEYEVMGKILNSMGLGHKP
jgi:tripartite-type tricarboxylate transporter receptor subunit TctC